jgi:hypothetical protein
MTKIMAPRIQELIGASPEAIKSEDTKRILADAIEGFRRDVPWCREKLHELIESAETADYIKLGAIKECLVRGLGLPIQYVEQNVNVRYQISDQPMTEDEWAEYVGAKVIDVEPTEH